mmetsp:Transcript_3579/g.11038  ORF Transcript_3579/g.11038 Transcript_3579/m.11038 type:complete len:632 (+) Transcript_3579:639-2534(+)
MGLARIGVDPCNLDGGRGEVVEPQLEAVRLRRDRARLSAPVLLQKDLGLVLGLGVARAQFRLGASASVDGGVHGAGVVVAVDPRAVTVAVLELIGCHGLVVEAALGVAARDGAELTKARSRPMGEEGGLDAVLLEQLEVGEEEGSAVGAENEGLLGNDGDRVDDLEVLVKELGGRLLVVFVLDEDTSWCQSLRDVAEEVLGGHGAGGIGFGDVQEEEVKALARIDEVDDGLGCVAEAPLDTRVRVGVAGQVGVDVKVLFAELGDHLVELELDNALNGVVLEHLSQGEGVAAADDEDVLELVQVGGGEVDVDLRVGRVVGLADLHGAVQDEANVAVLLVLDELDLLVLALDVLEDVKVALRVAEDGGQVVVGHGAGPVLCEAAGNLFAFERLLLDLLDRGSRAEHELVERELAGDAARQARADEDVSAHLLRQEGGGGLGLGLGAAGEDVRRDVAQLGPGVHGKVALGEHDVGGGAFALAAELVVRGAEDAEVAGSGRLQHGLLELLGVAGELDVGNVHELEDVVGAEPALELVLGRDHAAAVALDRLIEVLERALDLGRDGQVAEVDLLRGARARAAETGRERRERGGAAPPARCRRHSPARLKPSRCAFFSRDRLHLAIPLAAALPPSRA